MTLLLTSHARARLEERGLSMSTLQAIAEHGEVIQRDEDGAVRLALCGHVVVLQGRTVVSAWPPPRTSAKASPKRAARAKGQAMRRYAREGRAWSGAGW